MQSGRNINLPVTDTSDVHPTLQRRVDEVNLSDSTPGLAVAIPSSRCGSSQLNIELNVSEPWIHSCFCPDTLLLGYNCAVLACLCKQKSLVVLDIYDPNHSSRHWTGCRGSEVSCKASMDGAADDECLEPAHTKVLFYHSQVAGEGYRNTEDEDDGYDSIFSSHCFHGATADILAVMVSLIALCLRLAPKCTIQVPEDCPFVGASAFTILKYQMSHFSVGCAAFCLVLWRTERSIGYTPLPPGRQTPGAMLITVGQRDSCSAHHLAPSCNWKNVD